MWILPSSLQQAFVPAWGCSIWASASVSNTSASEPSLRLSLSGIHTLRPFSNRVWKNRPWSLALFGAGIWPTSTASPGLERWICSLLGFRASRSALQESKRELEMNGGSGQSCSDSSKSAGRRSSSLKMCLGLLEVDLDQCSAILPRSGSMRSGCLSQRNPWVPRTVASESSCWLTPHGVSGDHGPDGNEFSTQILKWSTPRANEGKSPKVSPAGLLKGFSSLTDEIRMWATPRSSMADNGSDSGSAQRQMQGENLGLKDQAQLWTTPTATDRANRGNRARKVTNGIGGECNLADDVEKLYCLYSPQHQAIPDGQNSSTNGRGSRLRLNPAFVCHLQGWPWWWTRAEVISCAAPEMASWLFKVRQRLSSLCGER